LIQTNEEGGAAYMRRNVRILMLLALGSTIAGAFVAMPASGVHQKVQGGTPFRVPLVPRFVDVSGGCTAGRTASLHGGGLPVKAGCNNPVTESVVAKLGTSTAGGTRVGQGRLDVCGTNTVGGCTGLTSAQVPDVRIRGNSSDILCAVAAVGGANDPCPGGVGSDYDPRAGAGPYLWGLADPGGPINCGAPTNLCSPNSNKDFPSISAGAKSDKPCYSSVPSVCGGFAPSGPGGIVDMIATATIPKASGPSVAGNAIRVTDHWNNTPSTGDPGTCATAVTCTATVVDQPFPVPVICAANTDATIVVGSYCGLNTTANALVPDVVEAGKNAVTEVGQIQIKDLGVDGVSGNADDQVFGVQGLYIP
jgi:hypothetical protein